MYISINLSNVVDVWEVWLVKIVGGVGEHYLQVVFLLNITILMINFVSNITYIYGSCNFYFQLIIYCLMCNSHFVVMMVSIYF